MGHLNSDDSATYQREGILFPIPVLTVDEAAEFAIHLNVLEDRLGGRPKTAELHQLFHYFRWAYELVTHSQVLDAVESVLGPNLLVWGMSVFTKHPYDPGFISWHQDGTYWGLDSGQITTAWIALTPSTTANGCMRVVPGSQTLSVQRHVDTYAENNLLSRGQEIAVEVDEQQAVDVVLQPGEMSLHHVNIVHGSRANESDQKRVGIAIRYITPEVRQDGHEQRVLLARGIDKFHHFPHLEAPTATEDLDAAVDQHLRATRAHITALRQTKGAYESPKD